MNTPSTALHAEAVAPFTHIFLSLDLLEEGKMNEEILAYLSIIRQNTIRLQNLILLRSTPSQLPMVFVKTQLVF